MASSTAARRAVAVTGPFISAEARIIGTWCVLQRTPSTIGRPGPRATGERWARAVDAARRWGAAADADGRRAALLRGGARRPDARFSGPK